MKRIRLSPNSSTLATYAIVDDADYDKLSQHTWHVHECRGRKCAMRTITHNGKTSGILMARQIMGAGPNEQVDHINHNAIDNRRQNLRCCTLMQNLQNQQKKCKASSVYKGVTWNILHKKWLARIGINYKRIHLGYFTSEVEAAKAYDKKAVKLFGEFACLNFAGRKEAI